MCPVAKTKKPSHTPNLRQVEVDLDTRSDNFAFIYIGSLPKYNLTVKCIYKSVCSYLDYTQSDPDHYCVETGCLPPVDLCNELVMESSFPFSTSG